MPGPELNPHWLYVMLFGPGQGECVVVRGAGEDPPWLVIDSCRVDGAVAGGTVLPERKGWALCLLSHRHRDHWRGFDQLLRRLDADGVVACSDLAVPDMKDWVESDDPVEQLELGGVESIVAAIESRWRERGDSRWSPRRGDERDFGDLHVDVLHPNDAAWRRARSRSNVNHLSTVLRLRWGQTTILLGADAERGDWQSIAPAYPDSHSHNLAKVPHHGSSGALHPCWLGRPGDRHRIWCATPFNGRGRLPRWSDGEGAQRMLGHVDELHVTGLPLAAAQQGAAPLRASRADLRDGRFGAPALEFPGGMTVVLDDASAGNSQAGAHMVAFGFDDRGGLQDRVHGDGTVIVGP